MINIKPIIIEIKLEGNNSHTLVLHMRILSWKTHAHTHLVKDYFIVVLKMLYNKKPDMIWQNIYIYNYDNEDKNLDRVQVNISGCDNYHGKLITCFFLHFTISMNIYLNDRLK